MLSLAARTVGDQAHGCPPSRREHFRGWRDRISFHRTSDLSDVCCNDTVAMMRRMIESPPRRWPRSRTNLARKRSFHPLAYSQEKARWNVYQVRYTCTYMDWSELTRATTKEHAYSPSESPWNTSRSFTPLQALPQFRLSAWTSTLPGLLLVVSSKGNERRSRSAIIGVQSSVLLLFGPRRFRFWKQ